MTPKSPTLADMPVEQVLVGSRLRPVSEAGVDALVSSIRELGVMKDPIHVRKKKGGTIVLMAGGHRLAAAKVLGWPTIPAQVWTCTDDWARLMEIDDNLASAELTALDTAVFLAERKRVYEKLHPEMAVGAFRGNQHTGNLVPDIMSFTRSTAEKFGLTDRHVRRLLAVGTVLTTDQLRWLRAAPGPVTLKDLQDLAKVEDDHIRSQVCIKMSNGDVKKAAQAVALLTRPETAPKDPVEEAFIALRKAWSRAPKEARKRFLTVEGLPIFNLLREIKGEAE